MLYLYCKSSRFGFKYPIGKFLFRKGKFLYVIPLPLLWCWELPSTSTFRQDS